MRLRANDADVLRAIRAAHLGEAPAYVSEIRTSMEAATLDGSAAPKTDGGMLARLRRMGQRELVEEVCRNGFDGTAAGWRALAEYERRAARRAAASQG